MEEEDVTVRLEPSLGSLLANYEEKESTSGMSAMRERLRETERELRSAEGARDKLRRDTEWLVERLEERKAKVDDDDDGIRGGVDASLRAERDELEMRVADLEAELNEARLEARKAAEAARRSEAALSTRHVVVPAIPEPQTEKREEDGSLVEELSKQSMALRTELERERATSKRLERELREERSFKASALVAQERVRCLEKLLEERLVSEEELKKTNERAERLEQALAEWKSIGAGDDPIEARRLASSAKSSLAQLQKENKRLQGEVEQGLRRLEIADRTAETALERSRNLEKDAEMSRLAKEKAERDAYLTSHENEALKEIVKTYDDPREGGEDRERLANLSRHLERFEKLLLLKQKEEPIVSSKEGTERILHLKENPLAAARRKKATTRTRDDETVDVDEAKLNSRLKERFREHLNWFREAVYLLTGFKIDMTTTEGGPHVRLRSMFAEDPQDALLFHWTDDGVQLLATPFANRLDERLFASLTLSNSVPAFLANVQLDLFERQTLMPAS